MDGRTSRLCLFDVDGTLTKPRTDITPEMIDFLLNKVKPVCMVALVGGSDYEKISEQLRGSETVNQFDYVFPENGVIAYKNGTEFARQSISKHLGEEKLQQFINFTLKYLSEIWLPCKRGTFIEFRIGMLNISPIGRSCSREERNAFEIYDREHRVREKMIEAFKKQFPDIGLTYSIGGQISFDVFPQGWDKTYCLNHLTKHHFKEIHFFGDKIDQGGNDYEIFIDSRTIGHRVTSPDDTKQQLINLFNIST